MLVGRFGFLALLEWRIVQRVRSRSTLRRGRRIGSGIGTASGSGDTIGSGTGITTISHGETNNNITHDRSTSTITIRSCTGITITTGNGTTSDGNGIDSSTMIYAAEMNSYSFAARRWLRFSCRFLLGQ